jgi:DNA-binding FadR family transcriptional regulator
MDSGHRVDEDGPPVLPSLSPVRKAHEQVADQLRALILDGEFPIGGRLPSESALAQQLGVSRATVREALRTLTAQNLIRTIKGRGGGSYVTRPTVDHVSEYLTANIRLLTHARDVSLDELIEARLLLEVPASRLAATRRREGDLERLERLIPEDPRALSTEDRAATDTAFHSAVHECCDNTLLTLAIAPVLVILRQFMPRSSLPPSYFIAVNEHHRRIAAAIRAGDPELTAQEMHDHVEFLRPHYSRVWPPHENPNAD